MAAHGESATLIRSRHKHDRGLLCRESCCGLPPIPARHMELDGREPCGRRPMILADLPGASMSKMCSMRSFASSASVNRILPVSRETGERGRFGLLTSAHGLSTERRMKQRFRCHRCGRRPCRLRSGGGGGAARRAHRAGHASLRHDRRDVVQPGHRRPRQGPSGARDRCARRPHGPRRRSGRNPVPPAQPLQGSGGAGPARPGRPQALSPGDAGGDPYTDESCR